MSDFDFSNILKNKRKEMHLSQSEIAYKLSLRYETISRIENGHIPNMNTFLSYCDAIGLDLILYDREKKISYNTHSLNN